MDQIASDGDLKRQLTELRKRVRELQEENAEALAREHEQRRILELVLDGITDGVVVADETGQMRFFNQVATATLGVGLTEMPHEEWSKTYGVFRPDTVTLYPPEELPLVRAVRGEAVGDADLFIRNRERPEGLWLSCASRPLLDEEGRNRGGVVVFRDVTNERLTARQLRERDEKLRRLTSELIVAEDRERKRIAADLHDGLGQILSLVQLKLVTLTKQDTLEPSDLKEVYDLVRETHESVRSLTFRISPPILHDLGLAPAIQWLVEDLGARHDLDIQLTSRGAPVDLDERERILLYRTVRELVINVGKHAGVRDVRVSMNWRADDLLIRVEDDGSGFEPEQQITARHEGFGLFSIRERLDHLGGATRIESRPGSGTVVEVSLPLEREDRVRKA